MEVEHFMHEFWELVAFVTNVIISLLLVWSLLKMPIQWNGFCHSWSGLLSHSCGSCDKHGNFLSIDEEGRLWIAGKDAIVVWWGALRGAIGLALALVVYSEQFRFEFSVSN